VLIKQHKVLCHDLEDGLEQAQRAINTTSSKSKWQMVTGTEEHKEYES